MKDNALSRAWRNYKDTIIPVLCLGVYVFLAYLLHIPCPFRYATGIPCPGCGMTRAYLLVFEGDFAGAFAMHPLWPLIPIALVLLAVFHGGATIPPCLSRAFSHISRFTSSYL